MLGMRRRIPGVRLDAGAVERKNRIVGEPSGAFGGVEETLLAPVFAPRILYAAYLLKPRWKGGRRRTVLHPRHPNRG